MNIWRKMLRGLRKERTNFHWDWVVAGVTVIKTGPCLDGGKRIVLIGGMARWYDRFGLFVPG